MGSKYVQVQYIPLHVRTAGNGKFVQAIKNRPSHEMKAPAIYATDITN